MAYILKDSTEYKKELDNYIENNPLKPSFGETALKNFSSSNLSDLYQLFLDLRGSTITRDLYDNIKNILQNNFSINPDSLFTIDDTRNDNFMFDEKIYIPKLLEIIKNKYLNYISKSNSNEILSVDKNELYKLSLIMNKYYPEIFLDLIKSPNQDIEQSQNFIKNKILDTIDHWNSHNSKEAEDENRDIAGAFYIAARKLYPDLNIFIPGRIKSMRSSTNNIEKEIKENLASLTPSDVTVGLTNDDIEKQFSLADANTDFSGFTVVLANTDDTLHFDKTDPRSTEILELRKIRNDNINFTHSLENFLSEKEDYPFSILELYQIKLDLLKRLRSTTYEECTKEYKDTSFSELLKSTIKDYDNELQNPSTLQVSSYLRKYLIDEIYELLDELKKRVHDKYQAKLLEIAIPEILSDNMFSNTLKVNSHFVKRVRKKNGFCTDYYCLETADGRKIELQAQSKKRFEDSKNGPSDHSLLPNKEIDISRFFEPAYPDSTKENFEYFLDILNTTPIATKNYLFNTPDTELSSLDKRLKRKLKIAEQNIKLIDNIDLELPIFAEYVSPKLMTVSSHHTRFHKSVAGYNKKSLVSGFTEVLLKHDSTTCLAQILIDKLETLVPSDKNQISLNGINKRSKLRNLNDNREDIDER